MTEIFTDWQKAVNTIADFLNKHEMTGDSPESKALELLAHTCESKPMADAKTILSDSSAEIERRMESRRAVEEDRGKIASVTLRMDSEIARLKKAEAAAAKVALQAAEQEIERLRAERDTFRGLILTEAQLRGLARFIIKHGDLDNNAHCLSSMVLENKADAVRAALSGGEKERASDE